MDSPDNPQSQDSTDNQHLLFPEPEKIVDRVPSLSKVDGVEHTELEVLNKWFSTQWKNILSSDFVMTESLTQAFTDYLESDSSIAVDLDKADAYLSVQKLLYKGLRFEALEEPDNVSQCKLFHSYYYSCRENPTALNNLVVLSNVIWSLKKYKRDEFALTCLVDILLQSYMVALDSFITLGGVNVLRETLEYLAQNGKLKESTNYLLKVMELLDKLDINFKILQTSKIGIPVNCIALAKSHAKLKLDYECGNDKVKLKATNLIKKWKAIRDASMPQKVATDNEVKHKKGPVVVERKVERQHSLEGEGKEHEGSFVLNIINTIVEEKEKEKKRKLELRNSQMSSKYKSKSMEEKEKDKESEKTEKTDKTTVESEQEPRAKKVATTKKEDKTVKQEPIREENGNTNKLESLMNFFKEYSTKGDEKKQPAPPAANAAAMLAQTNMHMGVPPPVVQPPVITPPVVPPPVVGGPLLTPPMEYRMQFHDNPSLINNYAMLGKVLPPGVIPPPPPGPPGPPMAAGAPGFIPMQPGTPTHSRKQAIPEAAYSFDNQNVDSNPTDKQINFFRSGSETSKDKVNQDSVVPPWK